MNTIGKRWMTTTTLSNRWIYGFGGFQLFGWGTLGLINAGLAENKGRNRVSWLLLSFLLGPVATAYIVFANPVLIHSPSNPH